VNQPRLTDNDSIERFRAYLKLLACSQIDSYLGRQIDASDVVQQTLLDAVARNEQFRGGTEAELLGWLRQILANNIIDVARYHGRVKRDVSRIRSLEESISQSFRRVDALVKLQSTPSQRAATNEQLLRLPEALEQLPEAQRQAIMLHHLQGLRLAETAQRMGKSEAAVGGLLHRGLRRLHEILGD
jgi:RNA polymerase sigma-70 factor (ECF subfamily)